MPVDHITRVSVLDPYFYRPRIERHAGDL